MLKGDPKTYIYGKHTVLEALKYAPDGTITEIFLAPSFDEPEITNILKKKKISAFPLSRIQEKEKDIRSAVHQGIAALVSQKKLMREFSEFVEALEITADTSLVLLDELQDPQNIGAVIRSAAAFGASGVLIPGHNQAQVTGSVIKVSAGMAFKIPLVAIGNVNNTIENLKKKGFWIYGLAGGGEQPLCQEQFDASAVIVVGNEAKGIRQKTLELCDIRLSIPIHPRCESLNAAASAAAALYAWSAKHPNAVSK